jgi:hypothetical protein
METRKQPDGACGSKTKLLECADRAERGDLNSYHYERGRAGVT